MKTISKSAEMFSEKVTENIVFMRQKMELGSDRENLIHSKWILCDDGKSLYSESNTVDHPDYPINLGCVRMKIYKCTFVQ